MCERANTHYKWRTAATNKKYGKYGEAKYGRNKKSRCKCQEFEIRSPEIGGAPERSYWQFYKHNRR